MSDSTATMTDVKVEDAGPCRKKISITIDGDAVTGGIEETLAVYTEQAQLPGFRPGHAPRKLIEKKFGKAVRDEAKGRIISEAYQQALRDHDIKPVGEPDGGDELKDIELTAGEKISFTLEVEVAPEFELPELDGIEVKKPVIEITDEHVNPQLERLLKNEGELEERDDAEPGDYLMGKGIMSDKEGAELLNIEGAVVQVPEKGSDGSGAILGVIVDDFAKQIGTPKSGETITIKTKGPEHHEDAAIRDKDVTIAFEISSVQRIMPAKVEDLLPKFGLDTEEELREWITLQLNRRAMVEQQTAMRQQVASHLIDHTEMELPEKLTSQQAERSIERARAEMMYRGVAQDAIERRTAELRASSGERAARELKLFFILEKAAESLKVEVGDQEIMGRIAQMAQERGQRPEALRDELIKRNQVGTIHQQVREHKTLDAILAKAKTEEVDAKTYNESIAETHGEDAKVEV
ncbi:MAG: trigger factor [Planctomycetota bacterium]